MHSKWFAGVSPFPSNLLLSVRAHAHGSACAFTQTLLGWWHFVTPASRITSALFANESRPPRHVNQPQVNQRPAGGHVTPCWSIVRTFLNWQSRVGSNSIFTKSASLSIVAPISFALVNLPEFPTFILFDILHHHIWNAAWILPKPCYVAGWWDYFIAGIATSLYPADAKKKIKKLKILQSLHPAIKKILK